MVVVVAQIHAGQRLPSRIYTQTSLVYAIDILHAFAAHACQMHRHRFPRRMVPPHTPRGALTCTHREGCVPRRRTMAQGA